MSRGRVLRGKYHVQARRSAIWLVASTKFHDIVITSRVRHIMPLSNSVIHSWKSVFIRTLVVQLLLNYLLTMR